MTWLIAICIVIAVSGLVIGLLARYLAKLAREHLKSVLDSLEKEKEDISKKRAMLAADMFGMNMMAKRMDDAHKRVQNSIQTVKALTARIHDPSWMKKFEEGRDNAQWN